MVLHPLVDDELLADQRLKNLGLFAHALHIRPWEIEQLRVPEFRHLVAWLAEFNKPAEEG